MYERTIRFDHRIKNIKYKYLNDLNIYRQIKGELFGQDYKYGYLINNKEKLFNDINKIIFKNIDGIECLDFQYDLVLPIMYFITDNPYGEIEPTDLNISFYLITKNNIKYDLSYEFGEQIEKLLELDFHLIFNI